MMMGQQHVITCVIIAGFCACVCVTLSYPEVVTGVFFILMTLLWFTREPGFVPGWTSLFEKQVPIMHHSYTYRRMTTR